MTCGQCYVDECIWDLAHRRNFVEFFPSAYTIQYRITFHICVILVQDSLLGIVYAHTLHFQVPVQELRLHSHQHRHISILGKAKMKLSNLLWVLFWKRRMYNFDLFWCILFMDDCKTLTYRFGKNDVMFGITWPLELCVLWLILELWF